MASRETEIRGLERRTEDNVTSISDRFGNGEGAGRGELARTAERMNKASVRRVVEDEATRCLPALQRAARVAAWGRQLQTMAAFAGDAETAEELGQALEQMGEAT